MRRDIDSIESSVEDGVFPTEAAPPKTQSNKTNAAHATPPQIASRFKLGLLLQSIPLYRSEGEKTVWPALIE